MQYDIQLLEKELDELDRWDFDHGDSKRRKCLTCIERDRTTDANDMAEKWSEHPDFDLTRTRPVVLAELRTTLVAYGRRPRVIARAAMANVHRRASTQGQGSGYFTTPF